jgi:hypothetical protein
VAQRERLYLIGDPTAIAGCQARQSLLSSLKCSARGLLPLMASVSAVQGLSLLTIKGCGFSSVRRNVQAEQVGVEVALLHGCCTKPGVLEPTPATYVASLLEHLARVFSSWREPCELDSDHHRYRRNTPGLDRTGSLAEQTPPSSGRSSGDYHAEEGTHEFSGEGQPGYGARFIRALARRRSRRPGARYGDGLLVSGLAKCRA